MRKIKDETFREFQKELESRAFLLAELGDEFCFYEEVEAKDLVTGKKFRFDALSVCEATCHVLAWEFKKSHLSKSDFGKALKQAADYRSSSITDVRLPGLKGEIPEACILFPDWNGLHDNGEIMYEREAAGMRLMASHFRVGTYAHQPISGKTGIMVGEQSIFRIETGWTSNADGVLRGSRPKGSGRALDPKPL